MDSRPPCQLSAPFPCPSLKKPPDVVLQLKVVGLFKGVPFQIAKCTAECLKRTYPDKFKDPIMVPLHEFAWHEFLREKKRELKGETWRYPSTVMCFINDQLLGNEGCLQKWAYKKWGLKDFKPIPLYEALTSDYVADYVKNSKRPMVFLEVTMNKRQIGRMIFEISTWEKEMVVSQFTDQHLKMKTFQCHMIKEEFLVWSTRDGTRMGHSSISHYRKLLIWIENMLLLGMYNRQLIEGTRVLQILEVVDTMNERPVLTCRITDCGNYR
ncbi:probable inactive peptidyl-prolyl cis-trans isomerase-like 6 isoform X4 [Dromiciops gliroides]|uniref:probable inactive peptidyl-prolyl cis-trans isomerase-like 6 isoform X4 n=1 Tax=Dromiciops gliroides TaxID=33562 RepID=UPI001CC4BB97|nr:probable inactive peptidyl-prolyl cis-trans isomerase-like 6 isoform X4 [Dromiciops gliroides]